MRSSGTDQSSDVEASASPDSSPPNNGVDDVNCEDFEFQEDAQDFFDRQGGLDGGDEDRLDEDPGEDDGDACEDLPSRSAEGGGSDSSSTPSGGVDSGLGGTAPKPTGGGIAPLVLVGGGAIVLFTGLVLRRRATD